MNVREGLRVALQALAANKLRSALTTLGVVIGVGAVIAMVALGQGAQKDVEDRIKQMGSNLVTVAPGQAERGHIWHAFGSAETITVDDCDAIRKELPEVAGAAPEIRTNAQCKNGSKNGDFQILGSFSDYYFVRNVELDSGRFYTALDDQGRRRVCVIGSETYSTLFGDGVAVGKRIKIKTVPFTVIGVMKERGGFGREDTAVLIPLSTLRQRFAGTKYVRQVGVAARDGVSLTKVENAVRKLLRRRHRLRADQGDDFSIATQQDILGTVNETSRTFTLLLAGIASISLLVGGIGIMNIMLVTVTERTREIGIRKALGARQRDIRLQFLIESTVLSVFGGLLGIALGVWIAHFTASKGIATQVSPSSVAVAFLCAAGIGVFFGYYPANQAGKLDPIEALRYE